MNRLSSVSPQPQSVRLNSAKCSLNANAAIFFSSFGPLSLSLIKISPPPSHLSQTFIKSDSNCHNAATNLASPETGPPLPSYWLNKVGEVSLSLCLSISVDFQFPVENNENLNHNNIWCVLYYQSYICIEILTVCLRAMLDHFLDNKMVISTVVFFNSLKPF